MEQRCLKLEKLEQSLNTQSSNLSYVSEASSSDLSSNYYYTDSEYYEADNDDSSLQDDSYYRSKSSKVIDYDQHSMAMYCLT